MSLKKLKRSLIRTDGGTQVRVELDKDTFLEYSRQMKAGVKFPPVDVFFDGSAYWLSDGFHRFYGARESGIEIMDANVHNGTVRDAVLFAVGANAAHGKPRSNKDKRHAVEMLLADEDWREWSDVKIAEQAMVSHTLVQNMRKELATVASCEPLTTTIGKDGKRRKKPKKKSPTKTLPAIEPPVPTPPEETETVEDSQPDPPEEEEVFEDAPVETQDAPVDSEQVCVDQFLYRFQGWIATQRDNLDMDVPLIKKALRTAIDLPDTWFGN